MELMTAIAWIGIMILLGMVLRAKVPFLRNMMVPASVIGGVLGFIGINAGLIPVSVDMNNTIVGQLFTFVFISLALTRTPSSDSIDKKSESGKSVFRGIIGMGSLWAVLYGVTPLVAYFVIKLTGAGVGMDPVYGLLIPFAFCQGPGQSVTYGTIIEAGGVANAVQVAVTFASLGFLIAFLVGVPFAKMGIKKGLATDAGELNESAAKGLFKPEEQAGYGKMTTHPSNIDALTFHIALIGLCWVVGTYAGKIWLILPGYIGETMSTVLYFNGMLVAYAVRAIMGKLNLTQYIDSGTQMRVSGFSTDVMVTGAFMGISMVIIQQWLFPIIATCIVVAIVTWGFCRYFGARFGGPCDFERTLGVWGACTGTVPSGMALIRIVDPNTRKTATFEMGPMNPVNTIAQNAIMLAIISFAAGEVSFTTLTITCVIACVAHLAVMFVTRSWGPKTYSFRKGEFYDISKKKVKAD